MLYVCTHIWPPTCQTIRQTDKTDRQTDRWNQTDRQADGIRQTDRQTESDRQTDYTFVHTHILPPTWSRNQTDRQQTDRHRSDGHRDRQTGRQTDG
jgi:hypothetical protein